MADRSLEKQDRRNVGLHVVERQKDTYREGRLYLVNSRE